MGIVLMPVPVLVTVDMSFSLRETCPATPCAGARAEARPITLEPAVFCSVRLPAGGRVIGLATGAEVRLKPDTTYRGPAEAGHYVLTAEAGQNVLRRCEVVRCDLSEGCVQVQVLRLERDADWLVVGVGDGNR
jgi:hypothetical protein